VLALSVTFLAAVFFLGPDLLSRFVLSFVVPRRNLTQTRGEEITRAILWAAVPLLVVWLWVSRNHVLSRWGDWQDVEIVSSALYSSTFFDAHRREFFASLVKVAGMTGSLLWREYFVVLTFALLFYFAIRNYRWIRSAVLGPKWTKSLFATVVLPRVSEWHVLLSDMLLPQDDVVLMVDVLTKSGILYQGSVQDKMLAPDGSLQTLTLSDPRRFLREDFKKAKEADKNTKASDFWHPIPSKLFVIIGSDITSINVRHQPRTSEAGTLAKTDLSEKEVQAVRNLLSKLSATESPSKNG